MLILSLNLTLMLILSLIRAPTAGNKKGATDVMNNMVALKNHGYHVEINFSLGNYNKDEWEQVLN